MGGIRLLRLRAIADGGSPMLLCEANGSELDGRSQDACFK